MINFLRNLHNEESGQDLIEYALIIGLMALGSAALFPTIATKVESYFTYLNNNLTAHP